jgi:hypothetical protein
MSRCLLTASTYSTDALQKIIPHDKLDGIRGKKINKQRSLALVGNVYQKQQTFPNISQLVSYQLRRSGDTIRLELPLYIQKNILSYSTHERMGKEHNISHVIALPGKAPKS